MLGYDVDIVNSVQFSNHTGYPGGWEGDVLDGDRLLKLVGGMERNGLLSEGGRGGGDAIGHVLTGYIGSDSFLRAVVSVVERIKALNPACRYCCCCFPAYPVFRPFQTGDGTWNSPLANVFLLTDTSAIRCSATWGDSTSLGSSFRFTLTVSSHWQVTSQCSILHRAPIGTAWVSLTNPFPQADVLTPNQFEVEQLTGIRIGSIQDAQRACRSIHDRGVELVLITSVVLEGDDDEICLLASRRRRRRAEGGGGAEFDGGDDEQHLIRTPRLPGQFTGTGDVCAALFLAHTDRRGDEDGVEPSLAGVLGRVAGTMNSIVERTAGASLGGDGAGDDDGDDDGVARARRVASRELQLIRSRDDIINPPGGRFRARRVDPSGSVADGE